MILLPDWGGREQNGAAESPSIRAIVVVLNSQAPGRIRPEEFAAIQVCTECCLRGGPAISTPHLEGGQESSFRLRRFRLLPLFT